MIDLFNIKLYNCDISSKNEELVKITSSGTISIPKQFRMFLEMQKEDHVKVILENNYLVVKKITIS